MITQEQINHELCVAIIHESIEVIKDESFPADFRAELKNSLLEVKEEVERMIVLYE
jgi:hypothetical protein